MVVDTLLRTVAAQLRTSLNVDESYVRVMPDAYPIPGMGAWFISVYGGRFRKVHEESYCIRGPFHFHLTMTCRTMGVPFDKQGTDLTAKATTGVIAIFENAIKAIENNTSIVTAANSVITYKGIESAPILNQGVDFEAKPIRGGGPTGWLNAANNPRAGFIFEAQFLTNISIQRS